MILANVRRQLGREDAQLALQLIARESGIELDRAEAQLRDEGMDTLLDDPRLLAGLLGSRRGAHASYGLFVYVVIRHALMQVGENERALADYVASVLMNFGVRQRAFRLSETDDERYATLAEMCTAIESADAQRSFLGRAHLGNYALWLSGVFPDHIEHRRWRRGGPDLDYYEEMGRRGFKLAAAHTLAEQYGLTTLYAAAAERFALLRLALNNVSDSLLFPHVSSPERVMRQVRSEFRRQLPN